MHVVVVMLTSDGVISYGRLVEFPCNSHPSVQPVDKTRPRSRHPVALIPGDGGVWEAVGESRQEVSDSRRSASGGNGGFQSGVQQRGPEDAMEDAGGVSKSPSESGNDRVRIHPR